MAEKPYSWVPASGGDVPANAVEGGPTEMSYVGRGRHENHLIPGKIYKSQGRLFLPHGGDEVGLYDYEVLVCDKKSSLTWAEASDGKYPENAVEGGFEGKMTYYVGRAAAPDGTKCVGKVHPNKKCCYVSWGGKEHKVKCYEVLTYR